MSEAEREEQANWEKRVREIVHEEVVKLIGKALRPHIVVLIGVVFGFGGWGTAIQMGMGQLKENQGLMKKELDARGDWMVTQRDATSTFKNELTHIKDTLREMRSWMYQQR